MASPRNPPAIALPSKWPRHVKSAVLHVIAVAQYALTHVRGRAANSRIRCDRLKSENEQLLQQIMLLE